MSTTIRVSETVRERVAVLAASTGVSMQAVVERAVRGYEDALFWREYDEGYRRLEAEGVDVTDERTSGALRDGLDPAENNVAW